MMAKVSRKVLWHEYDKNSIFTFFNLRCYKCALRELRMDPICRVLSDTVTYVSKFEKRGNFAHFPNFAFKTLISLEP